MLARGWVCFPHKWIWRRSLSFDLKIVTSRPSSHKPTFKNVENNHYYYYCICRDPSQSTLFLHLPHTIPWSSSVHQAFGLITKFLPYGNEQGIWEKNAGFSFWGNEAHRLRHAAGCRSHLCACDPCLFSSYDFQARFWRFSCSFMCCVVPVAPLPPFCSW